MLVNEVMSRNVISLSPDQSVRQAAKLMCDNSVGAIPVAENGKVRGIVTDRDIVLRCVACGNDADSTKIREIMTSGTVYVNSDNSLDEAMQMMSSEQVRRLPVMDGGKLCGILSVADIARSDTDMEIAQSLSDISQPD